MPKLKVKLDGTEYMLDTQGENLPYQKFKDSEFDPETDSKFWRSWVMRSFHGGERQERILRKEDLDNFAYHDGEGVDVSAWGKVKIQPALSRALAVQSATMPMTASGDGQTAVIGLTSTPYIKYTTNGSSFSSATGACVTNAVTVTDLVTAPTGTIYGVQGTKIIYSTDDGHTWTNDATASVPTDMVAVTYCAGQLYALGSSYLKYYDGDSWQTATSTMGGTICCTFQENVYFAKDDCLFKWTGNSTYQDDRLPAGFVITSLVPYRKILWILGYFNVQGGKRGAVFYVIGGYEGHLYSLEDPSTSDYGIRALAGSDDEVYIANPERGGVDRYDLTDSGLSSGPAWNAEGYIPPKGVCYFNGYVLVGRYDNVSGTDGVYTANVANPTTYRSTGWLKTSEYDFGFGQDYKIFKSVTIRHTALAAGEQIQVEYSLDQGTTWTVAGITAVPGSTFETFLLTDFALVDCRGANIRLRLTLTAGTSQLTTPTLTEVRVDAAPMTEEDWSWRVRLMLPRSRQGDQLINSMEDAADEQRVLKFEDLRGKEYDVVVDEISVEQRAGDENSAIVYLVVRSV